MANNIELGIVLASLGVKRVLQRQPSFSPTVVFHSSQFLLIATPDGSGFCGLLVLDPPPWSAFYHHAIYRMKF